MCPHPPSPTLPLPHGPIPGRAPGVILDCCYLPLTPLRILPMSSTPSAPPQPLWSRRAQPSLGFVTGAPGLVSLPSFFPCCGLVTSPQCRPLGWKWSCLHSLPATAACLTLAVLLGPAHPGRCGGLPSWAGALLTLSLCGGACRPSSGAPAVPARPCPPSTVTAPPSCHACRGLRARSLPATSGFLGWILTPGT